MSVVVAIKEGNKVYIGSDSQVTKGGSRTTLKNPNNYKIWKVIGAENCLMAHVGMLRDANVIRLHDDLVNDYDVYKDRIGYRFVVKYIVPEILSSLVGAKYIKEEHLGYMDSSFLFAYQDQLFSINSDSSVIEINDYVAIGSGAQEAIGSLVSSEGEPARERIIKAIKASAANDIYVDYPIILTDTESTEFEVIFEGNDKKKGSK